MRSSIILIFLITLVQAQNSRRDSIKKYFVEPAFVSMRSTHGNYFNGLSFFAGQNLNKRLDIALGVEHSKTRLHNDNDWILYNLKYTALLVRAQYTIAQSKNFTLSGDLRTGISFVRYQKEETLIKPGYKFPVRENGFYVYGGLAAKALISKNLYSVLNIGLKGINMSTNVLEVNPHGLNFAAGLQLKL